LEFGVVVWARFLDAHHEMTAKGLLLGPSRDIKIILRESVIKKGLANAKRVLKRHFVKEDN